MLWTLLLFWSLFICSGVFITFGVQYVPSIAPGHTRSHTRGSCLSEGRRVLVHVQLLHGDYAFYTFGCFCVLPMEKPRMLRQWVWCPIYFEHICVPDKRNWYNLLTYRLEWSPKRGTYWHSFVYCCAALIKNITIDIGAILLASNI